MPHIIKKHSCGDLSPNPHRHHHEHPHVSSLLSLSNEVILPSNGNGNGNGNNCGEGVPLKDEMTFEQREQDPNCGEVRQRQTDSSAAKQPCVRTDNVVTPTRVPNNVCGQSTMKSPPLLPSVGATVAISASNSNSNAKTAIKRKMVDKGVPSVVQIEHTSSDNDNPLSASDDVPSLTQSTGTPEETGFAETPSSVEKAPAPSSHRHRTSITNASAVSHSQHSIDNTAFYPNAATALPHMPPSASYYPPQPSPYPNHHPAIMGPPLHVNPQYPINPYQHWPNHSYPNYYYNSYDARPYPPQIPQIPQIPYSYPNSYSSQPSQSLSYNNTKTNPTPNAKGSLQSNPKPSNTHPKSNADNNTKNTKNTKNTPTVVDEGTDDNIAAPTQTIRHQTHPIKLDTQRMNVSPFQQREDIQSKCDNNGTREKDEGSVLSNCENIKDVDTPLEAGPHSDQTEAIVTDNESTPKSKCKRRHNDISPDVKDVKNVNGDVNGTIDIKTEDGSGESPQKKLKETTMQNDYQKQFEDSSGDVSARFTPQGHGPTNPSYYPSYPHYMPPAPHGGYSYGGMMPRYDQMHPYPGGEGYNSRYFGPPYPYYDSRVPSHMQGGWSNSGGTGLTTYPQYHHHHSQPSNTTKSIGERNNQGDAFNSSKSRIKGITDHIEQQQVLEKNTKVCDDSSHQDSNHVKSAGRCVKMPQPHPTKFWSEKEINDTAIPDFQQLVNYPSYINKTRTPSYYRDPNQVGTRFCVMCGKERRCSYPSLSANGGGGGGRSRQAKSAGQVIGVYSSRHTSCDDEDRSLHIIPRQNKGLCTSCDVAVWIVIKTQLEIKWCKGCKNFKAWAAFGEKGHATKCVRCRERQREKYANKKELMMKNRDEWKSKKDSDSDRDELRDGNDSPKRMFSPRDHGGLSCLLAATAQVTSSL